MRIITVRLDIEDDYDEGSDDDKQLHPQLLLEDWIDYIEDAEERIDSMHNALGFIRQQYPPMTIVGFEVLADSAGIDDTIPKE